MLCCFSSTDSAQVLWWYREWQSSPVQHRTGVPAFSLSPWLPSLRSDFSSLKQLLLLFLAPHLPASSQFSTFTRAIYQKPKVDCVTLLFKIIGMKSGSLMCLIRPTGFGPRSFCLLGSRHKTVLSHSGILWMMFLPFKMFPILSTFPDLHGLIPTHPSHPIWEVTCPRSAPDPSVPPASSDVSGQCPAPSLIRQHFNIMLSYWLTLLNVKFCDVSDLVHPFLPNT